MTIGEKVREFRVKHLLTLRRAADVLGVSCGEVFRIENGKNKSHFITEAKWEKKLQDAEEALKNE